ncbi:MAG: hypothetical protein AMXMBFR36_29210 [Acidobacteriota bacterium]
MPTRNVVLTEHQAALVERLVKSGRYQNASEVLRTGLRLLEQQEAEKKARLAALRDAVQVGLDDLEAGRFVSFADGREIAGHLSGIAARRSKVAAEG